MEQILCFWHQLGQTGKPFKCKLFFAAQKLFTEMDSCVCRYVFILKIFY